MPVAWERILACMPLPKSGSAHAILLKFEPPRNRQLPNVLLPSITSKLENSPLDFTYNLDRSVGTYSQPARLRV